MLATSAFRWGGREAPRRRAGGRKAERAARPDRRRRRTEPGPPVGRRSAPPGQPSLPAKAARRRPETAATSSARAAAAEADTTKPVTVAEVGDIQGLQAVAPHVARELMHGRDPQLRECSVPLGPQRRLSVRQVERVDNGSALPAVVGGRTAGCADPAMGGVAQPHSGDVNRIDVQRQRDTSDGAGRLERGDHSRNLAGAAAGDELERLAVVERLDRLRHPDGDVLGMDDARSADRRSQRARRPSPPACRSASYGRRTSLAPCSARLPWPQRSGHRTGARARGSGAPPSANAVAAMASEGSCSVVISSIFRASVVPGALSHTAGTPRST